jgi:hypothetical protein
MTSADWRFDDQQIPTKLCSKPGCAGVMHFHAARDTCSAPHTLEWPWLPMWVCSLDSSHLEAVTPAERALITPIVWRKKIRDGFTS